LLKNLPFTLRQAQGEREEVKNARKFPFVLSLSKHGNDFFSNLADRFSVYRDGD
jgi:hypothetical protein